MRYDTETGKHDIVVDWLVFLCADKKKKSGCNTREVKAWKHRVSTRSGLESITEGRAEP